MNRTRLAAAAVFLGLSIAVGAAHAGPMGGSSIPPGASAVLDPLNFEFDENGNGRIQYSTPNPNGGFDITPWQANNGFLAPDPTGGVAGNVLTYLLGATVTVGDQVFYEPGTTIISDVLRFTNATGSTSGFVADRMIFYSDLPEVGEIPDLADTGLPTTFNNAGFHEESGPEGDNFVLMDFGFPSDNRYRGISDAAVPEPATIALAGVGALAGLFLARRSAKRA